MVLGFLYFALSFVSEWKDYRVIIILHLCFTSAGAGLGYPV